MTNESDSLLRNKRLRQLLAEVEGSSQPTIRPESADRKQSTLPAVFLLWSLFGLLCLGSGFWIGSYNEKLRLSLQPPSETQLLTIQGWRKDGTGVFYRWCSDHCHAPRLYGGGVIQVFEVKCVDRPCGDLSMVFNVLNNNGQVIDSISLKDKGLQGETRRFLVESTLPAAVSLELSEFSARARV